ncbi:MAG: porin [Pseudorhodobacter sp.]
MMRAAFIFLSALLAFAVSPAPAQITLSGQAAMGLDLGPAGRVTPQTRSRLDLRGVAVTDGGVQLGAQIRLQGENGGPGCERRGSFASAQGAHRGCRAGAPMLFMEIGGN